jgi:Domain of unknown function (DUF4320)
MSESAVVAVFATLLWAIAMFSPEFAGHYVRTVQAKEVKDYVIQLVEKNGGYTTEVQSKVEEKMESYGLDESDWTISYPSGTVNYEQEFEVTVEGRYRYKVFNLLGTGLGNFEIPIVTTGTGIGKVYFR